MAKKCRPQDVGCRHPNSVFGLVKRTQDGGSSNPPIAGPQQINLVTYESECIDISTFGIKVALQVVHANPSLHFVPIRKYILKCLPYAATNTVTGSMFTYSVSGDHIGLWSLITAPLINFCYSQDQLCAVPSGGFIFINVPTPANAAPAAVKVIVAGFWTNLD